MIEQSHKITDSNISNFLKVISNKIVYMTMIQAL